MKHKTTREVLEERDLGYSEYKSEKALFARYLAIRCQYFLPYFKAGIDEESNVVGLLFGCKVIRELN